MVVDERSSWIEAVNVEILISIKNVSTSVQAGAGLSASLKNIRLL